MEEQYIDAYTVYKVTHGSRAYGTNIPGSDYDEKGICILPDLRYYFGFKRFDQKDSGWKDGSDRVIYDVRKFFSLALKCNPNIIEVLYVAPGSIVKMDTDGELIRANRDIFLSRRAAVTFTGYAVAQMKKLKARVDRGEEPKWKHAMHLVRLLRMGKEIVQTGKVWVKRPDADDLLEIRYGDRSLESIFAESEKLLKQVDECVQYSPLPREPKADVAEMLLIDLIKRRLA